MKRKEPVKNIDVYGTLDAKKIKEAKKALKKKMKHFDKNRKNQ
jgi:hypothetical protein